MFRSIPTAPEAWNQWINCREHEIFDSVYIKAQHDLSMEIIEAIGEDAYNKIDEAESNLINLTEEKAFFEGYNYAVTMLLNAFIGNMAAKENSLTKSCGKREGIAANGNLIVEI